ncbi:hypothetical protein M153_11900019730 [Pseudoloma neurophilia]|uniref:Uncharacterized protein n=1 Tax=Pseudoloma neurophilia TaxID=146866 RepID=A0A0R0M074_9MICR|nr:hypothetical protein M153_11900019730 [Pseudoloma neurophilia]
MHNFSEREKEKFKEYLESFGTNLTRIGRKKRFKKYSKEEIEYLYAQTIFGELSIEDSGDPSGDLDNDWPGHQILKIFEFNSEEGTIKCLIRSYKNEKPVDFTRVLNINDPGFKFIALLKDYRFYLLDQMNKAYDVLLELGEEGQTATSEASDEVKENPTIEECSLSDEEQSVNKQEQQISFTSSEIEKRSTPIEETQKVVPVQKIASSAPNQSENSREIPVEPENVVEQTRPTQPNLSPQTERNSQQNMSQVQTDTTRAVQSTLNPVRPDATRSNTEQGASNMISSSQNETQNKTNFTKLLQTNVKKEDIRMPQTPVRSSSSVNAAVNPHQETITIKRPSVTSSPLRSPTDPISQDDAKRKRVVSNSDLSDILKASRSARE